MRKQETTTASTLKGARVLVVQDDPFAAADLDLVVEEAGGEVVALAGSVDDALTVLDQEPVDAAIVDPDLGGGEGTVVIEELKRREIPFATYAAARDEISSSSQEV